MLKKIFALVIVVFALCACKKTPVDNYIPVTGVSLNQANAEMLVGETLQLQVKLTPSNATEKDVMWGTSKQSVATVSATGLVTAVGEGTAIITVTAGYGKTATCNVTVIKPRVEVQSVTLDKDDITIVKGQSAVLEATVSPADATDVSVTWSTSDEAVAKVDQNGKVTAVGGGSAVITAAAGSKSADCSVTVTVPVESISLDRKEVALVEGETASLTAIILPDDATDKSVEWTSSNGKVAIVDTEGNITAVKEGTASITAKTGDKTAACNVTVSKKIIHVESITIDRPSFNIEVGASEILSATILPDDATDKSLTWASTNATIAEVDQTGKVTAKAAGTVTITATTTDGGLMATCEVTVFIPFIPIESLSLDRSEVVIEKGRTISLTPTIIPENASDNTVSWKSSNNRIVSVSQQGVITAIAGGNATIIASAGDFTATCIVTVVVPVTSIVLSQQLLTLTEGEQYSLTATIIPSDATNPTITWSSDNTSVATIDSNGTITAVSEGTSIITASADEVTVNCMVTINKKVIPVSSLTIEPSTVTLNVGESMALSALILPTDATEQTIKWSTSNNGVAEVNSDGIIRAVAPGIATITAEIGIKWSMCTVTVLSDAKNCLTFISTGSTTVSLLNNNNNAPVIYYSYDARNWIQWDYSALTFSSGNPLYFYGYNPSGFSTVSKSSSFVTHGSRYYIEGSIMSLIDKETEVNTIPCDGCFHCLFIGNTALIGAPTLPATTLKPCCYDFMFSGCTGLKEAPALPAKHLEYSCYEGMFGNCYGLSTAPDLPATELSQSCYQSMFSGCLGLKKAPTLPATTVGYQSYREMFKDCTNLEEAPYLPATTLAWGSYDAMFKGCTSLKIVYDLPESSLAELCYRDMFYGCTSLTKAPKLPSTQLADMCYISMFAYCTNLTIPPELPALTLTGSCYSGMFAYCTNLTTSPLLPAQNVYNNSYAGMFMYCTRLNTVICLAQYFRNRDSTKDWLLGVSATGTFIMRSEDDYWSGPWPEGASGIPVGWTVQRYSSNTSDSIN